MDRAVVSHEPAAAAAKKRFSPSAQIALGIAGGAALGLFVGERTAPLQIVADAYIKLLQMTVLPYVTVSIIGGLGALDAAQARTLGKRVGLIMALLWAVALAAVLLFPLTFPPNQNASFFSTTLLQEREAFDLYGIIFDGHPDLRRILMWDGFKDFPMRRDYVEPDDYEYEPTAHDKVLEKAEKHAGENTAT